MRFVHPIFLILLLLLPVLWFWMGRAKGSSRPALALKCAVFALLVIALADPWIPMRAQKLAITVLVDTSTSMPRESLGHAQAMLRDLVRQDAGVDLRLITFGERAKLHAVPRQPSQVAIPLEVDPTYGMATDIEGALQLALSSFPAQGARRILLVSDGNENRGHALAEALRARERGVSVFSMPSGGTAPLPVQVESIASPQEVFTGERFTLAMRLDSERDMAVRIAVTSQGREIGANQAELRAGSNSVNVDARIAESGLTLMEVRISAAGSEQVLLAQAVSVRRPRILYVFAGETSVPLLDTLGKAQVDIERVRSFPVDGERNWDAVVLDNYPEQPLPAEEEVALEKYVYDGGGLIFVAGDRNAKLAEEPKTPLERMLPVRALPPPEKPAAVVLVLDKSGSMSGQKIEMAREAARSSIKTLRPTDKFGVIAFDESYNWIVPLATASSLEDKSKLISELNANGGTKIYQAAKAAFDAISRESASRKHIILLTDGVSTPGTQEDFPRLEREALAAHVTISTIGLGEYINRDLLLEVARNTKGKSHFVDNPQNIPQVISGEVRSPDDLAIQERAVRAVRVRPVEFTDGIDFASSPRLLGFVQSEAREGSETILRVDRDKPLLVRWHYGLGRVVAFMSDARGRWSAPWVRWESFGSLWPQMVRDVSHRDRTVRAGVRPGSREGEAVVYYDILGRTGREGEAVAAPSAPPEVRVEIPGEAARALPLEETSPGHYEARIPPELRGLFRIVSGDSQLLLPEAGFYRESDEMKPQAINLSLLSEISRVTGGRVRPSIEQLLSQRGSILRESRPLWPYLLVLALLLNFVELALRKGMFEWLAAWLRGRSLPLLRKQPA